MDKLPPEDHVDLVKLIITVRIVIVAPAPLASLASSRGLEKFCTPLDHAPSCDASHTTSQCQQDDETIYSLSARWVAAFDSRDLLH
jgi:hypothetical protein